MNRELNRSAQVFVAKLWGKLVGFIAVLHFPHPKLKNAKRVSRLVVLPDYQGLGIGKALLNFVGDYYKEQGFKMTIATSHPAINKSLGGNWVLTRQGRMRSFSNTSSLAGISKTQSSGRMTCTWEYR